MATFRFTDDAGSVGQIGRACAISKNEDEPRNHPSGTLLTSHHSHELCAKTQGYSNAYICISGSRHVVDTAAAGHHMMNHKCAPSRCRFLCQIAGSVGEAGRNVCSPGDGRSEEMCKTSPVNRSGLLHARIEIAL